mgnify:CR=1 FL=1
MILVIRRSAWSRALAWWLAAAMLLPWLAGCATGPEARQPWLAGVVVDGRQLARADDLPAWVRVWRDGQPLPVRIGMRLQEGDRIATHASADAVIRYPGGTELVVRGDSRGRIGSFSEALGEFFARVWGVFSIETEYVRAATRGTAFTVRAGTDGTVTVLVLNGGVEIRSRARAWRPVLLSAGAIAVAHPQAPQPRAATAAEVQQAQAWIERVEQLVPPERSAPGGAGTAALLAIGAMAAILLGQRDTRGEPGEGGRAPPPTAPPLAAPTGLRPGTPQPEQAPTLDCRAPPTLSWNPVAGAQDYLVTLETRAARATATGWSSRTLAPVAAPRSAAPTGLDGALRWTVRARDARGEGPAAPWQHVVCGSSVIR